MNNKHINGFNTSVFTTPASNGTDQQFYSDTITANYDLYVGNVNVMAEIATKQDIINSNVNLEVDTLTANKIICPLYNDASNLQFTINDVLKMELSNTGLDIFTNTLYCGNINNDSNIETENIISTSATINNVNTSTITGTKITGTNVNSTNMKTSTIISNDAFITFTPQLKMLDDLNMNLQDITSANTIYGKDLIIDTFMIKTDSLNDCIGIGMANPKSILHIGDLPISMLNADVGIHFGTQTPSIPTIRLNGNSNHNSEIIMSDTNGNIGKIKYDTQYNTMSFITDSIERMRLTDTGLTCTNLIVDTNLILTDSLNNRVGINKTPTVALDVEGGITSSTTVTGLSVVSTNLTID